MPERMDLLRHGATELGLDLTEPQLDQFERYYRELADWNQRMNLTSITGYEDVQVRHFLDSLTCFLTCSRALPPGYRVIDLGAGAGFPGLPLKLVFPQLALTLVDSVGKKTGFLRHLVESLEITGVEILTGRAEELAHREDLRERFDLALARGLARMPVLLEYALPFCRTGGRVVAWKHGGIQQELASAERALEALGGRYAAIHPVTITGLTDNRILVVVEKVRSTPLAFPRRPGMPAKQPI